MLKSNDSINKKAIGKKGAWMAQNESAHLPPLWSGFDSRTCRHVSLVCCWFASLLWGFFSGSSGSLPSTKNHFSKFQLELKTVDKNRHSGMSITKFTYHKRQRLAAWVHYEEGGLQSGGLAEETASTLARVTSFARVSPLMIVSFL